MKNQLLFLFGMLLSVNVLFAQISKPILLADQFQDIKFDVQKSHDGINSIENVWIMDSSYASVMTQDDWLTSERSIYSYNTSGENTGAINYYWNSQLNLWYLASKYEIVYDTNGNQIDEISYRWDSDINDWIPEDKIAFTFDLDNRKTETIGYL
jgi:hypothetical protein